MAQCPKCGSKNAWQQRDRVDVTLRCLCGYNRVIASLLDIGGDTDADRPTLKLPVKGSNLWRTLMALGFLIEADSGLIAECMSDDVELFKAKDVASYLYVLKGKGFVRQATVRKRMAGGSQWRITDQAYVLIQGK
jgi:hypothetical protein